MTAASELLRDLAQRAADTADTVLEGLDDQAAHTQPGGTQNSIAWLLWHAARQEDVQVAQLADEDQLWTSGDWASRLGVDRGADDFGFGDDAQAVGQLTVSDLSELSAYLHAVAERSAQYVDGLTDEQIAEVIDDSYDPPVTRGVRLVSTFEDASTHVGQAAYARTLVESGWSIGY